MHRCVTCKTNFDSYPIECPKGNEKNECEILPIAKICLAHPFGKGPAVGYTNGERQHLCCLNPEDNPPFSTVLDAVTCPKCLSFFKGILSNGYTN